MMRQILGEKAVKELRDEILRCYEVDINDAEFFYSTTNCAFIFKDNPYMVRVSFRNAKEKSDILNEVLWVDDLKREIPTICEPKDSVNNRLMEELAIDDNIYRICMFRTAKGAVIPASEMTPLFLICVGELIGRIHNISEDELNIGLKFKRTSLDDYFAYGKQLAVSHNVDEKLMAWVTDVESRVKGLDRSSKNYGLCHCDLHPRNFFAEVNNIWLFDFDSAAYSDYMYDISTFLIMSVIFGYGHGRDIHKVIHEEMLPYLRQGYELVRKVDDTFWDRVDLFIIYRVMNMSLQLFAIDDCGVSNDLNRVKMMFQYWLSAGEEKFFENVTNSFLPRG